jgi:serine/threonine protein phosphatase 1
MRYAIGDIHGGVRTFRTLLGRLYLNHCDHLITLGDYVDRGPDSKGVLDTIMGLMEAGYDVTPLLGNHDDMMLKAITDPNDSFARSWFGNWSESFGIRDPAEVPKKYVNFLKSLPLIAVEPDYVFVHAGLAYNAPVPITDSQPDQMLWQESGVPDKRKIGGRVVVTGHLITSIEEIRFSLSSDRIYLDNGAFTADLPEIGNLVALNLDTKELIIQPWLDGAFQLMKETFGKY